MRVSERIIGLAVAFGLIGAVLIGVEAQTPPWITDASEPGVLGDSKAVLSRVTAPDVAMPKSSVPTGDFSGMPVSVSGATVLIRLNGCRGEWV